MSILAKFASKFGAITRTVDEPDGIIVVVSTGKASRKSIDEHYDYLRILIAKMRNAGRPVRVLSDQRRAVRLTHEMNQHIKDQIARTYLKGDRLALLMNSTEDQAYVRQILGGVQHAVFVSKIAAEIWLMEPDQRAPGVPSVADI